MKTLKAITFFLLAFMLFGNVYAQETQQKETTLRILTFNILHGATTKGDFDLDKIASVIIDANPDLVALQEVDFKTRRAHNYDLATELGWRTKMAPLFGIAMPFDGGAYGEGILSKQPILASETVALPYSEGNEPRAALSVLIQTKSGDTIRFTGTHLDHKKDSPDRINQVKKLKETLKESRYPSILAGDMNDTPESETISILKENRADSFGDKPLPTFPSNDPSRKIDYILFSPSNKWEVIENRVICDSIASDHCAVLSVLRLKTN